MYKLKKKTHWLGEDLNSYKRSEILLKKIILDLFIAMDRNTANSSDVECYGRKQKKRETSL